MGYEWVGPTVFGVFIAVMILFFIVMYIRYKHDLSSRNHVLVKRYDDSGEYEEEWGILTKEGTCRLEDGIEVLMPDTSKPTDRKRIVSGVGVRSIRVYGYREGNWTLNRECLSEGQIVTTESEITFRVRYETEIKKIMDDNPEMTREDALKKLPRLDLVNRAHPLELGIYAERVHAPGIDRGEINRDPCEVTYSDGSRDFFNKLPEVSDYRGGCLNVKLTRDEDLAHLRVITGAPDSFDAGWWYCLLHTTIPLFSIFAFGIMALVHSMTDLKLIQGPTIIILVLAIIIPQMLGRAKVRGY